MSEDITKEHVKGKYGIVQTLITAIASILVACIALVPQIIDLQQKNSLLIEQRDELQAGVHADVPALEAENSELRAEMDQLQKELATKDQTIAEQKATVEQQATQIADLTARLENAPTSQPVQASAHTGKPDKWLTELDYFWKSGDWNLDNDSSGGKDNLGNSVYPKIITTHSSGDSIIFKLNGAYNWITGVVYQRYSKRDETHETKFIICADDITVWSGIMKGGMEPFSFEANLNHASELKIIYQFDGGDEHDACLANVGLWKE